MGQPALAVVGEQDDSGLGQRAFVRNAHVLQHLVVGLLLEIDAQELLRAADHAQLHRRRQPRVALEQRFDAALLDQRLEPVAVLVVADRGEQAGVRAERLDVPGDVGGAAEPFLLLGRMDAHDGHRCLGGDAIDRAEPVAVEHRIADDEHASGGDAVARRNERGTRAAH